LIKYNLQKQLNYKLKSNDEVDFLGYFLHHGDLKSMNDMKNVKHPIIIGYGEDIDKWYLYEDGRIPNATKPKRKNTKSFHNFSFKSEYRN